MKTEILVFTNDVAIGDDGWAQIAPFGDFPGMALIADGRGGFKKEKAIQRMDKQAVTNMVNEYAQSRRGLSRFIKSRPIYEGHPDVPGYENRYPDKMPKGVFVNLACREDGFYGEPVLTEQGDALIGSKKYRALSGRWDAEDTGIVENGLKIYRPVKFLSAGLTNTPNLPVQLLNEAETEPTNQMKKDKVIQLLASHGISIANDATDEQVSEGLEKLGEKAKTATTLGTEKATLANEKATLEGRVNSLTTEKTTLATERDNARAAFANERKARIGDLLDGAITAGRITRAERDTWKTRLENETQFANEAEALSKVGKQVKTESITLTRGDRKIEISNASERRDMVKELVAERMASVKCDYDAAFAHVQRNFPALFEAMDQPEVPARKRK